MKKRLLFWGVALTISMNADVFAQEGLPAVAVYATGNIVYDDAKAVAAFMTASLINTGRYRGIERPESFMAELNSELLAYRGSGENPVSKVGKRFGVAYVCVAEVAPVLDAIQISSYIMDVSTAGIVFTGGAAGTIKAASDLTVLADNAVKDMLSKPAVQAAPQVEAEPEEAAPEPAVYEPPAVGGYDPLAAAGGVKADEPAAPVKKAEKAGKAEKVRKEKPEYPPEEGGWMSAGAGWFFGSDFGGGIKWESGAYIGMPYYGQGGYLFFDAKYGEAFAGYQKGGGKWVNREVSDLPVMRRDYVNFGLFGKYPLRVAGNVKIFPLLGVDYEVSVYGNVDNVSGYDYRFDGGADWRGKRPDASALSALWLKSGGGVDIGLGGKLYTRGEALYGWRLVPNKYETDLINKRLGYRAGGRFKNSLSGHGINLRAGLGYKI